MATSLATKNRLVLAGLIGNAGDLRALAGFLEQAIISSILPLFFFVFFAALHMTA